MVTFFFFLSADSIIVAAAVAIVVTTVAAARVGGVMWDSKMKRSFIHTKTHTSPLQERKKRNKNNKLDNYYSLDIFVVGFLFLVFFSPEMKNHNLGGKFFVLVILNEIGITDDDDDDLSQIPH